METFLFTDIESSTQLWEEHPDDMAGALAKHDALVVASVAAAGGTVLKSTGDGVIAVFQTAPDAARAALDIQRLLAAEAWGPTGPLRVRMGVHSGQTQRRDGDHFGPEMNRAARIMAAGHGGQVLLSGTTAAAVQRDLPAPAALRDLGTHRLKDLTAPEHLYQLVSPQLESEFPALRTVDSRPNNLPVQTTEFLGRSDELAAIGVMLDSPALRLLTIAGPGGAGKTRLGLQVAAEHLDAFRDGAFFVDLSAAREPESAFETMVQALGYPTGGSDALAVLETRLRDKQLLLVLDNFEQITAAAPGVAELLQHAPNIKIVVTSRETLRIRGEHVFVVPPLSLPNPGAPIAEIAEAESVQLFVERARAVRSDFELSPANARTVAEVCLRLDGLPLAIELAAARLNLFTPQDLLNRLRERLDVLGAGGRDLPDRQRTLWGAIGWSYELLDPVERDLFELLSVFSASDLPAIEAILGEVFDGRFDLDALASLLDKSLIRRVEAGATNRFMMLLTIKEYAAERLAESPERQDAIRRAHATYFFAEAQQLQTELEGSKRSSALHQFDLDLGNLRTAWSYWVEEADPRRVVDFLSALWSLHEARGWYRAAIELATTTLAIIDGAEDTDDFLHDELTIRTGLARATMAVDGYGPEVEQAFQHVLGMAEKTTDHRRLYPVLRTLATYYTNIAEFSKAAEIGRKLLELADAERDDRLQIEAHYVFGSSTSFLGLLDEGMPHLEQAIELHDPEKHGSSRFRLGSNTGVVARVAYGMLSWNIGRLDLAVTNLTESLAIARELDHPYSLAFALYHNGFLSINRSRFDECARFADELTEVAEENEYPVWVTLATVLKGVSTSALGDPRAGLQMVEKGVRLYRGLTTPPVFWPLVLGLRSAVHAATGDLTTALQLVEEAHAQSDDVMASLFLVSKGDYLAVRPDADPADAAACYTAAVDDARVLGLDTIELHARSHLVALNRRHGVIPDGTEALAEVVGRFTEGLDEIVVVEARDLLDSSS